VAGRDNARRITARICAAVIVCVPGLAMISRGAAASASVGPKWGYAWADRATAANYTPNLSYQRQSNGRHVTIARSGTGSYVVTFPGLEGSNGGNIEVSAYETNGWCQVASWDASTDVTASVLCFAPGGVLHDQLFDILYAVGAGTPAFGYAWDDDASWNGTPSRAYSFDGKGGVITSQHASTGRYTLHVPHLANSNGTVKVTAYGSTPTLCSISAWTGNDVYVACNKPSGTATDADFDVAIGNGTAGVLGVAGHKTGYAQNYLVSTSGPLVGAYQFDSAGGALHSVHDGTGSYTVTMPHIGEWAGDVQLTVINDTAIHCAVERWRASGTTAQIFVTCADALGHANDAPFAVQYVV
jgi:hypothetical protein